MKKKFSLFKVLVFLLSFVLFGGGFSSLAANVPSLNTNAQSISEFLGTDLNGATKLTESDKYISSVSYITELDNGYNTSNAVRKSFLRKDGAATPFVSFFVDTLGDGGEVYKSASQVNGYNAYGYVAGTGEKIYKTDEEGNKVLDEETQEEIVLSHNFVQLKMKYNFASNNGIMGADGNEWSISEDSWKKEINGIPSVGVVKKGAVIVQKFVPTDEKAYPTSSEDWKRENPYSDNKSFGLHNVNFFEYFETSSHQPPFCVYQPSGSDLQKGIYIKVTVAYEIERSYRSGWWIFSSTKTEYKNIVEETLFYLCNTSGEVVFENLYFENPSESTGNEGETNNEPTSSSTTKKGGPISNNQGSIDGFRLDTRGNNFDITVRYNDSTNEEVCEDGKVFLNPGKYEFKIRTQLGITRLKTVYIHEYGEETNKQIYFGNSLFADGSERVFLPSERYPVYVAGKVALQTKNEGSTHAPLVGKVYRFDGSWDDVEREGKLPKVEPIAVKSAGNKNWSVSNLPAGNYEAIFANNEEYFDGTATGDTYTFVWRFTVASNGQAPVVNKEVLEGQIGVNDFANKHYVAKIPTAGVGNLLVVYFDELSAYNFASEYLASTVKKEGNSYIFDSKTYSTENEMLVDLRKKAHSMVEKRYFDLTDQNTYLTLEDDILLPVPTDNPTKEEQEYKDNFVNILKRKFTKDVLVFAKNNNASSNVVGEMFLNDKPYAYYSIDENGEYIVKTGKKANYFISVADYESKTVTLYNENDGKTYNIPYGVGIEQYLESKSAKSGRYKITETNGSGTTEFYATYIMPGDVGILLEFERNLSGATETYTNFGISYADYRIKANNIIFKSAKGKYDDYGLIKIKKPNGEILVYELSEAETISPLDEEGNYEIILVDRLGNSFSFFVEINSSSKVYELSLKDGNSVISKDYAFAGKLFNLKPLSSSNPKLEFAGWADSDGKIYKDTYTFDSSKNETLTAVWHYTNVEISVYDGSLKATYYGKVGEKQALPILEKTGYKLYGYRYVQSDGTIRFYRGQINYIPNVENVKLDAIWTKIDNVENIQQGGEDRVLVSLVDGEVVNVIGTSKNEIANLPALADEDGLEFTGWLYEYGLAGTIFDTEFDYNDVQEIGVANENAVKLVAIWITAEGNENNSTVIAGNMSQTNASKGTKGYGGTVANSTSPAVSGSVITMFSLLLIVSIIGIIKHSKTVIAAESVEIELLDSEKDEILNSLKDDNGSVKKDNVYKIKRSDIKKAKIKEKQPHKSFYRKFVMPCISFVLSFVMLALCQSTLLFASKTRIDEANAKASITNTLETDNNDDRDYLQSIYDNSLESSDEETYTSEEHFLYGLIQFDLMEMGYEEVFNAIAKFTVAKTGEEKIVKGIGFTNYNQAFEENGETLFDAGFVAYYGEYQLTDEDIASGVIIENTAEDEEFGKFKLMLKENWGPYHYVAYNQYVIYHVMNNSIFYTMVDDTEDCYFDAYGDVYDYDIGEICHYINYNTDFNFDVFGITEDTSFEEILETFRGQIAQQDISALEIDVDRAEFISYQALNDYMAHNQDESFLGVPAEELLYYEANIGDNQYYVILGDGTVQVLDIPPDKASIWERIWVGLSSIAVAVVGIVICSIVPAVGNIIGGAMISAAVEVFMQVTIQGTPPKDINWESVGKSALIGAVTGVFSQVSSAITATKAFASLGKAAQFFAKAGLQVGSGIFGGASTYLINAGFSGEPISFKECMKSIGLGVATGMIMFAGSSIVEKVATGINGWQVFATILSGSLGSFAGYALGCAINGQPFTLEGALLSLGMGAAMSSLTLVGGKIVGNIKKNLAARKEYKNYKDEYKGYSDDYEEFKSYKDFKKVFGKAGEGREWHHIVEQNQVKKGNATPEQVYNTDNTISLDYKSHRRISAIYSSKTTWSGEKTVRQWMSEQPYEVQYQKGIELLREIGVKI